MTHYLYVPFRRKEASPFQTNLIEEWLELQKKQNNEVIVCYHGEKRKLPQNAQISVLLPGQPGKPAPIHGIEHVPIETLCFFSNLSQHLRVTNSKNESILVPEIAHKMKEDGLFDNPASRLQIKLFFLDSGAKEARTMTQAFLNMLKKDQPQHSPTIRVDYYTSPQQNPTKSFSGRKKLDMFQEPAEHNRYSMYNNKESYPKLSIDDVIAAVTHYNQYKSSRCCGLSGLLGLNGLFSSTASAQAIHYLTDKKRSETDRFAYATQYIIRFQDNHLSQFLRPILDKSLQEHEFTWKNHTTHSNTGLALN